MLGIMCEFQLLVMDYLHFTTVELMDDIFNLKSSRRGGWCYLKTKIMVSTHDFNSKNGCVIVCVCNKHYPPTLASFFTLKALFQGDVSVLLATPLKFCFCEIFFLSFSISYYK